MEASLVKKISHPLVLLLFAIVIAPINTNAQNALGQASVPVASNPSAGTGTAPSTQGGSTSLSTLPEVDLLLYINPQRILNEAVPKLMPAKDVEGMRKAFEDVRKNAGV